MANIEKTTRAAEKKLRERRKYGKKMQLQQEEQKRKRKMENQMHQEMLKHKKKVHIRKINFIATKIG